MCCFSDVYLRRQCIVHTANCMLSIGTGFMLSFPAVLNPDILSPNGTGIHATPDQASWIAGTNGISGIVGFCFVPYVMQVYGRKFVHIALNLFYVLGFLILALATNIPCLYAARIIQGIPMCAVFITSIMVGEYSHPKRRGYFITIKKTAVATGALMCHSLALCWTWKQIAAFAVVPNSLAILFTLTWPESPSFLALTGKYEECDKSHMWLYGDSLKRVVPACFAIMSEIFPLEHKGIGTGATGVVFTILYSIVMKCTPLMIEKTGVEGTFGIYALHVIVGLLILYFILNETKDKTLQQIENEIKGRKQPNFNDYYLNGKPLICTE
ncbi:jg6293 [Pararge aegeria aegeria]|uniref:Jg6293 protein n=1 Tax=Pararge aegeria aegeria TaxID=348720 RepID=A0A8S4QVN9_9NEOP|nr:jg6293 [Pararge aegeria aegeria]